MSQGKINVSVENIFPLIKKFLYSDSEIFLRELVANATDATLKLKKLTEMGEVNTTYGNPIIEIKIDKDKKQLHVIDQGIGMTADEVQKYINDIAFSGAEEFLEKYKDKVKDAGIIGHFGLGFYSAFMVAKKVEIITKSYKDEPAAIWSCDGSPNYTLEAHDKQERGTEIILHIDADSEDYLEEGTIRQLLGKYNKFMPIPIKFGTREETKTEGEGDDKKEEKIIVDDIINNPNPLWIKQPSELKDEDYQGFYRELYPMQFEAPLFHIHLNVDYPFNLTGVLYFPKLSHDMTVQKDRIQLYQNQVYVTDNVEGIVPEFLTLLRGVIDSPDIPLNVSRSYLQADGNVKKISNHIIKKVADKLESIFKKNRAENEGKWNDLKIVIEYGMLSEPKFYERAIKFALFPTLQGSYYTFNELLEKIKPTQTDKDNKTVILYASNKEKQHSAIAEAEAKGYEVLLLDSPITPHLIQKIEGEEKDITFVRVDADHVDNLIKKDTETIAKLSEEESTKLKDIIEAIVPKETYTVQLENFDSDAQPFRLAQPEFMRRMKEMNQTGGGMFGMGNFPETYNLVVNANHPLATSILNEADETKRKDLISKSIELAKLAQGLLTGAEMTNFVSNGFKHLSN